MEFYSLHCAIKTQLFFINISWERKGRCYWTMKIKDLSKYHAWYQAPVCILGERYLDTISDTRYRIVVTELSKGSHTLEIGNVVQQSLLVLLGPVSLYPVLWSSLSNSFQDRTSADFIYGRPIFKWILVTYLEDKAPGHCNGRQSGTSSVVNYVENI